MTPAMLHFTDDWALLRPSALALAALMLLVAWRRWRAGRPAVAFAPGALLVEDGAPLPLSWRARLLGIPPVLMGAGILFGVVALAEPAERVALPLERQGIDIVLCLDTSSSMQAGDMDQQRTRWEVAQAAAARFIEGRPDDRIGLVGFARYPDLLCPPTLDHESLVKILSATQPVESDGNEDATGMGLAVARAAQVLESSRAPSRVLIVFTDGEENVAMAGKAGEVPPVHAGQLCQRLGIRAYTIVAGRGRQDASGAWVPLDTRPARDLASRTGGSFREARDAGAAVAVYDEIDALEKAPHEEPRYELDPRYLVFLLIGIGVVLAGRLMRTWLGDAAP